ncbi:MAG: hypothetical protein U0271_21820 [Polyangiaceae bacterium]
MIRTGLVVLGLLLAGCGGSSAPPANPETPFQREEVAGLGEPEVVVASAVNRPITVTLMGPKNAAFTVPAMETAKMSVPPGTYHYRAEAKGAKPYEGEQTFESDGRYTWSFVIIRSGPIPPASVVSSLGRALKGEPLAGLVFEGAIMGGAASTLPPSGAPGDSGWTEYPAGWAVRTQAGKITMFRFDSNVLSDLSIFDKADLDARFGAPAETVPVPNGNGAMAYSYPAINALFVVSTEGMVLGVVIG